MLLASSALPKALQRLGKEPVAWLFQQCANVWGYERYPQDHWHELQVFAVDGALFRTQETLQLRDNFGPGNTYSERQTPYPVLRLVALMNVRSHVLANAAISLYRRGEIPLAAEFIEAIPAHSVTLLDKGFVSADLLLKFQNGAANPHWRIPERKVWYPQNCCVTAIGLPSPDARLASGSIEKLSITATLAGLSGELRNPGQREDGIHFASCAAL